MDAGSFSTAVAIHAPRGELDFAITRIVLDFLGKHPRHQQFNDAIGVLECAKLGARPLIR
jgi:hypothetical protein